MNRIMKNPCQDFELAPHETIEMVVRRHWAMDIMICIRWVVLCLIITGGILVLYFVLGGSVSSQWFFLLLFFLMVYAIIVTINVFVQWLNTAFDIIFVTNIRIIDISQLDFFHRNIIETRLENIQDATGDVKGFLNTLFDFGRIRIRTANDVADFSIEAVQSPQKYSQQIFKIATIAKEKQENKQEENIKHSLQKEITQAYSKQEQKKSSGHQPLSSHNIPDLKGKKSHPVSHYQKHIKRKISVLFRSRSQHS